MLIQNIGNAVQTAPTMGRVGNDTLAVVTNTLEVTPAPPPSPAQLHSAMQEANHALQQSQPSLEFSVDSATHTPVVSLTDTETGQVIQQFPSRAALAIAQSIEQAQQRQGLLLNQKA